MTYYIIPCFILLTLMFALCKKTNAYESFVKGAKEGIDIGIKIFPLLLAMILATTILKACNILQIIFKNVDSYELYIQALFRPLSGNASLAMMIEIYATYGVDSKISLASSILQGSSDTTIYVITLYFGSVGIKKYKYAITAGLLADLVGFIITMLILTFLL